MSEFLTHQSKSVQESPPTHLVARVVAREHAATAVDAQIVVNHRYNVLCDGQGHVVGEVLQSSALHRFHTWDGRHVHTLHCVESGQATSGDCVGLRLHLRFLIGTDALGFERAEVGERGLDMVRAGVGRVLIVPSCFSQVVSLMQILRLCECVCVKRVRVGVNE